MNETLKVTGGHRLTGDVTVSGAKNSVLKLMAAALLSTQPVRLTNVPRLSDVDTMTEVLRHLGCRVTFADGTLEIDACNLTNVEAPFELVSRMRASFNVLGPLMGRFCEARVSLPGGCSIGKRGVDFHVAGLQSMGATVEIVHGFVEAKASRLTGCPIALDLPSMGATENLMVAAVLAEGSTTISNAAQEPEIVDLASFLNAMGADISGAGTHEITIHGVAPETLRAVDYTVMPDRIEAATFMLAAAATRGDVTLQQVHPAHLQSLILKLGDMGATISTPAPTSLRIVADRRLASQNVVTLPYPGFPTDLQAPMTAVLATAEGTSIVRETIYENRFRHVGNLKRMGADIQHEGNVAVITGVQSLSGAQVEASDLRAGAALVIAGLQAHGETEILNLDHLDRGYEALETKLTALGAQIRRGHADLSSESVSVTP